MEKKIMNFDTLTAALCDEFVKMDPYLRAEIACYLLVRISIGLRHKQTIELKTKQVNITERTLDTVDMNGHWKMVIGNQLFGLIQSVIHGKKPDDYVFSELHALSKNERDAVIQRGCVALMKRYEIKGEPRIWEVRRAYILQLTEMLDLHTVATALNIDPSILTLMIKDTIRDRINKEGIAFKQAAEHCEVCKKPNNQTDFCYCPKVANRIHETCCDKEHCDCALQTDKRVTLLEDESND